jgi:hypothetical protein
MIARHKESQNIMLWFEISEGCAQEGRTTHKFNQAHPCRACRKKTLTAVSAHHAAVFQTVGIALQLRAIRISDKTQDFQISKTRHGLSTTERIYGCLP